MGMTIDKPHMMRGEAMMACAPPAHLSVAQRQRRQEVVLHPVHHAHNLLKDFLVALLVNHLHLSHTHTHTQVYKHLLDSWSNHNAEHLDE